MWGNYILHGRKLAHGLYVEYKVHHKYIRGRRLVVLSCDQRYQPILPVSSIACSLAQTKSSGACKVTLMYMGKSIKQTPMA